MKITYREHHYYHHAYEDTDIGFRSAADDEYTIDQLEITYITDEGAKMEVVITTKLLNRINSLINNKHASSLKENLEYVQKLIVGECRAWYNGCMKDEFNSYIPHVYLQEEGKDEYYILISKSLILKLKKLEITQENELNITLMYYINTIYKLGEDTEEMLNMTGIYFDIPESKLKELCYKETTKEFK
jgi:hypothetical protein